MKPEIDTAAKALAHLREARDLLRDRRIDLHHGWFLCIGLASAFKDVLNRAPPESVNTPLGAVVREVLDRRLNDEVTEIVIRLTRHSLMHSYKFCYTRDNAVFEPGVFEPGVFVEETFAGAPADKDRTILGNLELKKGQVAAGSFLGKSPAEIVELAVAWCERVMAEIKQEAEDRGLALT